MQKFLGILSNVNKLYTGRSNKIELSKGSKYLTHISFCNSLLFIFLKIIITKGRRNI